MDTLNQDLRYAVRVLLREPVFSAIAVATLALGVGVTTGMFVLVNAALLRPLPVSDPARLMSVEEQSEEGNWRSAFSHRLYVEHRARAAAFSSLAAHQLDELSYRGDAGAEVLPVTLASANYFETLGIQPSLGRFMTGQEEESGAVIVISHDFWSSRFRFDPDVLGKAIVLNGQPLTIIGVGPTGFRGTFIGIGTAGWAPIGLHTTLHPGSAARVGDTFTWLRLIGRLAPNVTREQAEGVVAAAARSIEASHGGDREVRGARIRRLTGLPPGRSTIIAGFLGLLLATAGAVLVIASVNVAGMLLARATARRREIAMRLAIGATRWRLLRQLLVETLVLFGLGGAIGVVLAAWVADLLERFRPPLPVTITLDLSVEPRVIAFALLVSLSSGLIFGVAPVAQAMRRDLAQGLRESIGAGSRQRTRSVLVAGQFALTLALLVAAGLFVKVLRAAASTSPGFDAAGVATAHIDLEPHGYDSARSEVFVNTLLSRLRATRGLDGASIAEVVPLGFTSQSLAVEMPASAGSSDADNFTAGYNVIDPGYFGVLRIPLVAGRGFDDTDRAGSRPVAMINETLARQLYGPEDPIGRNLRLDGADRTIVGVVADSRYRTALEAPLPHVYLPLAQNPVFGFVVFARSNAEAGRALAALRREVRALDPDVPLVDAQPLEAFVALSVFPQRVAAMLVGIFGMLALVLAGIGTYGVMAFAVARRRREIAIRMALGADGDVVSRSVAAHGLRLAGIGVAVGSVIAFALTRALTGLLHGISPLDPSIFAGVAAALTLVALAASYIPARRAARTLPAVALRSE